jgi:cytochrome c-550 PedF
MSHPFHGRLLFASLALAGCALASGLMAQGNTAPLAVAPRPVDTSALPDIAGDNDAWITANPYRADPAVYATAQQVGRLAFEQNCSRCHGHDAVSAGIVPDLRYLDAGEAGDEWFITRFHHGLKRDGKVLMPPLGEALGQKTGWAIRSWLDSRHKN